jgi:uncharacterized phage protein (TIGR01671 family)
MRGFRVYDKQEKRMIDNPALEGIYLSGKGNLVKPANLTIYLMDRYVRMDSTGLADKNDKEIYEGDIVQWRTEDEILSCVVEYTEGAHDSEECPYMSGFSYRVIDAIDYPEDDEGETDYVTEVIGNIYDNPELLKESNK